MSFFSRVLKPLMITPEMRGRIGERSAAFRLELTDFFGYPGQIIRNVYLPTNRGETTEIDLLYVTQKGIFVIESKNYTGYIFGSEENQNWTSTLYMGKDRFNRKKVEKHHFYNPIWQNNTHIRCLKRYLQMEIPMYSIIVFSSHCELKQIELHSPDVAVCQQGTLSYAIRKIWRKAPDILTEMQIRAITGLLSALANQPESVREKHVQDIKRHLNDTTRCPRCGGRLVLRTARSGPNAGRQFYGCSNYPRCRYTKNI